MRRFAHVFVLAWLALSWTAGAAAAGIEAGGTAWVTEVVDGDTVVLDTGGQVRLVGIQAPKLPLGRPDFAPWPLADEAKAALEKLVLGARVTLVYGGARVDRHGRRLAHLYRDDGAWLQGEMLRLGLARVYSFRDNRALIAEMLAIEGAARAAGRGIWTEPFYAVRRAEATGAVPRDSFELVEGRVVAAAVVKGRAFLNFGADWKRDFTVSIVPRHRRLFEREGHDIAAYEGRAIRVRGWVRWWNGPMIEITHPEQIEMLAPRETAQ